MASRPSRWPLAPADVRPVAGRIEPAPMEFEVMYAVRGATATDPDELREELSELGHSVVIVGD